MTIISMVRKTSQELKYVLFGIDCDLVLFALILLPSTMHKLAQFLEIYSPVNMMFSMEFVLSTLTIVLSRVTARARKLARVIAL